MDLSDRRVVEFRQWAEEHFGIGSGGYPDAADLLSVVMEKVDTVIAVAEDRCGGQSGLRAACIERETASSAGRVEKMENLAAKTGEDPAFLDWLSRQKI